MVVCGADVRQMLGIFSVGVSFGLGSTDSLLTCMGLNGFLYQLYFWIFMPLVLIGVVLLVSLVRLVRKRSLTFTAFVENALPAVMRLVFLLYPSIVNKAFEVSEKGPEPCRWHIPYRLLPMPHISGACDAPLAQAFSFHTFDAETPWTRRYLIAEQVPRIELRPPPSPRRHFAQSPPLSLSHGTPKFGSRCTVWASTSTRRNTIRSMWLRGPQSASMRSA